MNLLLAVLALGLGDPDPTADLPLTMAAVERAPAPVGENENRGMWIGFRAGYTEAKDADNGTWTIGGQLRYHLMSFLAIEGSIEFRRDEYDGGDVKVFTIPIQVTALVYLPVDWKIRPYALGGVGLYVMHTTFSGANNSSDETDSELGIHLGFGAEWELNPGLSIDADFRYLFINEPPHVGQSNFDSWQLTLGLNFKMGK
jgi:opacity protein-like surface antigen